LSRKSVEIFMTNNERIKQAKYRIPAFFCKRN
jgi:hypothetical protein